MKKKTNRSILCPLSGKNTVHPKKGMGCSVGGIRYIMTEQLDFFNLMKNELKHFVALRRSLKDRCLSPFGTFCQQEEGR